MTDETQKLVFVCQKNGGKSQLAAALMRDLQIPNVEVRSAGTKPGTALNEQSVESLAELGIGIGDEHPKLLSDELIGWADRIIVLGNEAKVASVDGTPVETWITDEPSDRGIGGIDRMRLVRDDIKRHVEELAARL